MQNKKQKKFYSPGKLDNKGTKVSIKTRPYINSVVFNEEDPISWFRSYLSTLTLLVNHYEVLASIPNIEACTYIKTIDAPTCAKLKALLDFLALSPIEIVIKDQPIDSDALSAIERGETYERPR